MLNNAIGEILIMLGSPVKKGPRSIVICDLDGTIANISHRVHLAQAREWDQFHAFSVMDEPNESILALLWHLEENYEIAIITGRPEKWRGPTEDWLYKHGVPYDTLHMRPDLCFDHDYDYKREVWRTNYQDRDVLFVLEDRDQVVDMWRGIGLHCWQVRRGDY